MNGRYWVVVDDESGTEIEHYKAYSYADALDYAENFCYDNGYTSLIEVEEIEMPEPDTYWLFPDGTKSFTYEG